LAAAAENTVFFRPRVRRTRPAGDELNALANFDVKLRFRQLVRNPG